MTSYFRVYTISRLDVNSKMWQHDINMRGWTRFYIALAGTDTQYLIDMLEDMFGEGPLVDPDELATSNVKKQHKEALQAEKEVAEAAGEHDPSTTTKFVVVHA